MQALVGGIEGIPPSDSHQCVDLAGKQLNVAFIAHFAMVRFSIWLLKPKFCDSFVLVQEGARSRAIEDGTIG